MKGLKSVQQRELGALHELIGMKVIKEHRVAVDGGAHVGGWTAVLADHFELVHAFEPTPESFARLHDNLRNRRNVRLYQLALMNRRTPVRITRPSGGRDTLTARQVTADPHGDGLAIPLDELTLQACDFIKLDLEGCELFALEGAVRTIMQHRPVLLIEESDLGRRLGVGAGDVGRLLRDLRYRQERKLNADRLWLPE